MKFNFPFNNFTSGEWSPRMRGRTDVEQYPRACAELTNMLVEMSGGASYRGGTSVFPGQTATQIADLATYVVSGLAQPRLFSYSPYDSTRRAIVLSYFGDSFTYQIKVYSPTGGWAVPTTSSSASFNISNCTYLQIGDLLILTDKTGLLPPRVFYFDGTYKIDNYNWYAQHKLGIMPWESTPMSEINALGSGAILNPSATTGSIIITVTAGPDGRDAYGYQDRYIRLCLGTSVEGIVLTNVATSATSLQATVVKTLPAPTTDYGSTAAATSFWQEAVWYPANWPRTITAFQGRIIYGGTPNKPDTVWGSTISNYFWFQEVPSPHTTGPYGFASGAYTADNSRSFALTPNSKEASNIQALSSAKTLTIHTDRSEIVAYGSNGALGPLNVVFESSTSYGASRVQPERVNNYLTFVQVGGRKIRDVIFNFNEDQYKSTDLSFVVDHFFKDARASSGAGLDSIEELTRTEGESSILWARTSLGKLFAVTLNRDYEINAWSRITIAGAPGTAEPKVRALTHFDVNGSGDQLVLVVERVIDGAKTLVVEYMNPSWQLENIYNIAALGPFGSGVTARPVYLDCQVNAHPPTGYSYPATSWQLGATGGIFDKYFKNTAVSVVADGSYLGEINIGSDTGVYAFTLAEPAYEVQVGFKYKGRLVTMPIEQGGQTGVPMGRHKRVDELVVKFVNSLNCRVGHSEDTLEEIDFRDAGQPMNQPTDYFTGEKVVTFPAGYKRDLQVIVEQDKPYPLYISAVVPRGVTYD